MEEVIGRAYSDNYVVTVFKNGRISIQKKVYMRIIDYLVGFLRRPYLSLGEEGLSKQDIKEIKIDEEKNQLLVRTGNRKSIDHLFVQVFS